MSIPKGALEPGHPMKSPPQDFTSRAINRGGTDVLIERGRRDKVAEIWAPVGEEEGEED